MRAVLVSVGLILAAAYAVQTWQGAPWAMQALPYAAGVAGLVSGLGLGWRIGR